MRYSGEQLLVSFWPISEVATPLIDVGLVGYCGLDLLTLRFSHFDPEQPCRDPRSKGTIGGSKH